MPPLLIPLISTLWLDTFAVCLAIGLAPVERRARLRFAACCVMAETLMPLLGYAAASLLGPAGSLTDLLAAMVLIVAGGWSLREVLDEQGEVAEALARSRRSVATMLAAAVSVSLDELATGAVLGATHQSLMPTLPAVALQALAGSVLGLCLGRWAGARAGRGAGLVLVATGAWTATGVFTGRPA